MERIELSKKPAANSYRAHDAMAARIAQARPETSRRNAPLLVFSHLRWDFVFQRPQHLLTRCAGARPVYFFEEPIFFDCGSPRLAVHTRGNNMRLLVPHLPSRLPLGEQERLQRELLEDYLDEENIRDYFLWFYTPMALPLARDLTPLGVVYDCMDELSHFKGAPAAMLQREAELLQRADVVFTGGHSLFEAKKHLHSNIHAFPSSVDAAHFRTARSFCVEPSDQKAIPRARAGFFGVLDERFDTHLLDQVAQKLPEWSFVMIGPIVKIDPSELPHRSNIHYLGPKPYQELPQYLAGWDVALMPFALNDSTRFISPTKTPEYLAAGKPVVSTSIRDVVNPYEPAQLAIIADSADDFAAGIERARNTAAEPGWLERVDRFLGQNSWDRTWARMERILLATDREEVRTTHWDSEVARHGSF